MLVLQPAFGMLPSFDDENSSSPQYFCDEQKQMDHDASLLQLCTVALDIRHQKQKQKQKKKKKKKKNSSLLHSVSTRKPMKRLMWEENSIDAIKMLLTRQKRVVCHPHMLFGLIEIPA
ncbi:hypothetical protein B296_00008118 [Ensete ventricosum]|uniref:Uncharacterized protein n=1 Tax=Ensete ventricosum TaxID=4639 RepID=A0A427AMY1_ENSVE|nr:hypothetical protein B296_00008118 [Ensete ventricosum]